MNILVIGNGFDLAHGLPTKYTDFLEFCKRVFPIYENVEGRGSHLYEQEYLFDWNFNKEIIGKLKSAYESRRKVTVGGNKSQIQTDYPRLDEMYLVIKDNIWIEYFLQCNMYQKENWIDFESEVSQVIRSLDDDMHDLIETYNLDNEIINLSNNFLRKKYYEYTFVAKQESMLDGNESPKCITFKEIRNRLLNDLNKLIRALEIYLTEYAEKIDCNLVSTDIQQILSKEIAKSYDKRLHDTYVLSFNYTNTYQKLYINKKVEYMLFEKNMDYIHGKADINNTIETNNMVLGIDEYLPEDRRNSDVEFIAFKKYYQRIYKQTGCKYKKWIEEILHKNVVYIERMRNCKKDLENNEGMGDAGYKTKMNLQNLEKNPPEHNLYIFGHSLDVTDKDILRDLILNDNVCTTIFYHNKDAMGQQIANLVKVIGQDELIRKTGGSRPSIKFIPQEQMIQIEE